MTREEAKEIIEDIKYSLDISLIGTPEINEIDNAMAMAIKSLEAWDKVKEEIKRIRIHKDYLDVQGVTIIEALEIIDKHLAEVSE